MALQFQIVWKIIDTEAFYVPVISDAAKIYIDRITGTLQLSKFWPRKMQSFQLIYSNNHLISRETVQVNSKRATIL